MRKLKVGDVFLLSSGGQSLLGSAAAIRIAIYGEVNKL
jgi:hypothetical protein